MHFLSKQGKQTFSSLNPLHQWPQASFLSQHWSLTLTHSSESQQALKAGIRLLEGFLSSSRQKRQWEALAYLSASSQV
jgi:hypothetical protein